MWGTQGEENPQKKQVQYMFGMNLEKLDNLGGLWGEDNMGKEQPMAMSLI